MKHGFFLSCSRSSRRLAFLLFFIQMFPGLVWQAMAQGSLTPPGAPAPVMKTLDQIRPGIPIGTAGYNIGTPGFYYVTTNLTTPVGEVILIFTNNVTVDLNGFTLDAGGGSSDVIALITSCTNVWVRNGILKNSGASGMDAANGTRCRFSDLSVQNCSTEGIRGGGGATIENCFATGCLQGITSGDGTVARNCRATANSLGFLFLPNAFIENCTANNNASDGFVVSYGSLIQNCLSATNAGNGFTSTLTEFANCVAISNSAVGFNLNGGCRARDCSALGNQQQGFVLSTNGALTGCLAEANGSDGINLFLGHGEIMNCISQTNRGSGISLVGQGVVSGCVSEDNLVAGILLETNGCVIKDNVVKYNGYILAAGGINVGSSASNQIEGNTCIGNIGYGIAAGILTATNNLIIRNIATGNTVGNYLINANNSFVNASGGNLATNTNPNVNFSY